MTGPVPVPVERSCPGCAARLVSVSVRGEPTDFDNPPLPTALLGPARPEGEPAPARTLPKRAAGILLGCVTAFLGLLYFAVAGTLLGPLLLWPRTRRGALLTLTAWALRLTGVERRRRSFFFGDRFPHRPAPGDRTLRYLATRTCTGLVTGIVLGLLAVGVVLAGMLVAGLARGTLGWGELFVQGLLGGVLLFLDIQGLLSLAAFDARLVALAMLLGRARRGGRTPEQADGLLEQAHRESRELLTELREVAWRVYPTALDSLGLREALAGVSERCAIPVRTDFGLAGPLPASVETAAYFVVSEAVTNAAKHSGATEILVSVRTYGPVLVVRVEDDGCGGADPAGSGLSGLHGRVGALDGRLHVHSPSGGPTTITAELPCA